VLDTIRPFLGRPGLLQPHKSPLAHRLTPMADPQRLITPLLYLSMLTVGIYNILTARCQ